MCDYTEGGLQQWHILAPRLRKIRGLGERADRTLISGCTYVTSPQDLLFKGAFGAWPMLAKPAAPSRSQSTHSIVPGRLTSMLSRLETLPAELIAVILADPLLERRDVIALGLASETLWLHVLQHIEKDCWLAAAPLAGVEIACTGTYLQDLPESFAKNDLAKQGFQKRSWDSMCEARQINWHAIRRYHAVDWDCKKPWTDALKAHDVLAAGIPTTIKRKMTEELLSRCSPNQGSSPDASWVLRNLTTKEYVRCRQEGGGYVDHPDVDQLRVDDVLLMRICWTRLPDWHEPEMWSCLYRGSWAGHCFDIIPLEKAGLLALENGWRDSTDEVVKQAETVAAEAKVPRSSPIPIPPRPRRRRNIYA